MLSRYTLKDVFLATVEMSPYMARTHKFSKYLCLTKSLSLSYNIFISNELFKLARAHKSNSIV